MGPILYCDRCRGMEVGWNRKFLTHKVLCHGEFSKSFKLFVYTVTAAIVISVFPTATATVFSNQSVSDAAQVPPGAVVERAPVDAFAVSSISDPSVLSIDSLLDRNSRLSPTERARVARSVVTSARKYDVDPYLISSMLLVESSGNPFAISRRDAVGIMQIHVPTWGDLIDREGINLFQVEDNIDLGTRILKEYTGRYGLWDGVIRYLGAGGPTEEAMEYVSRVQDIYTDRNAD